MLKATITVVNGAPLKVEGDNELKTFAVTPEQSLHELLKNLGKLGWMPDGELPTYTTTGTYTIPIVKSK
jgi:hypothetical protein